MQLRPWILITERHSPGSRLFCAQCLSLSAALMHASPDKRIGADLPPKLIITIVGRKDLLVLGTSPCAPVASESKAFACL